MLDIAFMKVTALQVLLKNSLALFNLFIFKCLGHVILNYWFCQTTEANQPCICLVLSGTQTGNMKY